MPEVRVGLIPGAGGLTRFFRTTGRHRALIGQPFSSQEAHELGVVSEVVATGEAADRAMALATEILAFSPASIALNSQEARAAENSALRESIAFERRSFELMFATEDHAEGLAAFVEHRPADFQER